MGKSDLRTEAIWAMVFKLVDDGLAIIEKARETKDTGNITGTQYDSYGLAVFFDGKLYYSIKSVDPNSGKDYTTASRYIETLWDESNGRHKGWRDIPAGYGREWATAFVKEIKNSAVIPDKGFALIIFNAAFYSQFQEKGVGRAGHKYKILSQVIGDMQNIKSKYKGATLKGLNLTI